MVFAQAQGRVCVNEHTDFYFFFFESQAKDTHRHTSKRNPRHRLTSMHSAKHVHDQQPDRARQQPGGVVHAEVSGQPLASPGSSSPTRIRMSLGFPPRSPPVLLSSRQDTSFNAGSIPPTDLQIPGGHQLNIGIPAGCTWSLSPNHSAPVSFSYIHLHPADEFLSSTFICRLS